MTAGWWRALPLLAALGAGVPLRGQVGSREPADRMLATRAELEQAARQGSRDAQARVRARLAEGDLRPGDRVLLAVDGEPTLSDTFTVSAARTLSLPSPVGAELSVAGVLRAELQDHLRVALGRYLQHAATRAWPLVRLSIQGEVPHAGIHAIAADAVLADAVMAAGGTTPQADITRVRVERDGAAIWSGGLQQLLGASATVDGAGLHDGDQLVIPRRRDTEVGDHLRFAWIVVSLVGGIYGLTRVF